MATSEILADINTIFARVLRQNDLQLTMATTAHEVDGWDSLNHAVLLADVQKHFQVRFSVSEVLGLENIGQLCAIVESKLKA